MVVNTVDDRLIVEIIERGLPLFACFNLLFPMHPSGSRYYKQLLLDHFNIRSTHQGIRVDLRERGLSHELMNRLGI